MLANHLAIHFAKKMYQLGRWLL